jgi:hypothetical protein
MPVTRAEFKEVFSSIARGYGHADLNLESTPADSLPINRRDVALACLSLAKAVGKGIATTVDPLQDLINAKLFSADASSVKNPGAHFRPQDLVIFLITFTDGMGNGLTTKTWDSPSIRQPIIKAN